MSEETKDNTKGSWLIQFGIGAENYIVIQRVLHQHDDGTAFPVHPTMTEESSDFALCSYVCTSCDEKVTLNAGTLYSAGSILSQTKLSTVKCEPRDPNK